MVNLKVLHKEHAKNKIFKNEIEIKGIRSTLKFVMNAMMMQMYTLTCF